MEFRTSLNDLPKELLQYIVSLLCPYQDQKSCALVCQQWSSLARDVQKKLDFKFHKSLLDSTLMWNPIKPANILCPTITKRYSHSAVIYGSYMYVFGGFTSTSTAFNDLWKLNLHSREWIRPLTTGTYPSPKAWSSMVAYKNKIIVYGGLTQPCVYHSMSQSGYTFNELHSYNINTNKWDLIQCQNVTPYLAGQSACIVKDKMVVFGGTSNAFTPRLSSDKVTYLDLIEKKWYDCSTTSPKPAPRFGQTQFTLDENHIIIIGGSGGPNMVLNDVWLLKMVSECWEWKKMKVENPEYAAQQIWKNPGCLIGDKVVFMNKCPALRQPQFLFRSPWTCPALDNDSSNSQNSDNEKSSESASNLEECVNGKRGSLTQRCSHASDPCAIPKCPTNSTNFPSKNTLRPSIRPNAMKNRAKQLENLQKMDEHIKTISKKSKEKRAPHAPSVMTTYILDVSCAITESRVKWLADCSKPLPGIGPDESAFYSLLYGKNELILFGGIHKGSLAQNSSCHVSNCLYFLNLQHFPP